LDTQLARLSYTLKAKLLQKDPKAKREKARTQQDRRVKETKLLSKNFKNTPFAELKLLINLKLKYSDPFKTQKVKIFRNYPG
jgi:hypothetical protein